MMKYLEIGTEEWSIIVEVDVCEKCSRPWAFWKSQLWQNPSTGKVHRASVSLGRTECGVELPARTPAHRVQATVKAS